MANQQRRRRIEEQIKRELSEILRVELNDPRVKLVTLSGVEVTADLAYAKIFFTALGSIESRKLAEAGLEHAAGFLRTSLGKRLSVHNIPELRFIFDSSIEQGIYLSRLIDRALDGTSDGKD